MSFSKFFIGTILVGTSLTSAVAQVADDYGTGRASVGGGYCPALTVTMQRGSLDRTTSGQVSQLQRFLIEQGYLDIDSPTGKIANLTVQAIKDFQTENNLPSFGIVGSLTRAAIARVCNTGTATTGSANTSNTTTVTSNTTTVTGVSTPNPTISLSVSPQSIHVGEAVFVSWDTSNAISCTGRNLTLGSTESVTTTGYRYLYPRQTTLYRLECVNNRGVTVSAERTVTVRGGTQTTESLLPFVASVSSTSGPVGTSVTITGTNLGDGSYISWGGANGFTFSPTSISSGETSLVFSIPNVVVGSYDVSINKRANNASYVSQNTFRFNVVNLTLPTVELYQSSTVTAPGESFNVTWSSQNAVSCRPETRYEGGAWTYGTEGLSGTRTYTPSTAGTYQARVTCTGVSGTAPAVAAISHSVAGSNTNTNTNTSTGAGSPTIGLSASSYNITKGQSTQVAWNTANATACTAYYGGRTEALATQGLLVVYPNETTTYRLVCTNGGYSAEKSVTVTVTQPSPVAEPAISFYASPESISYGQGTIILWTVTSATKCIAQNLNTGSIEDVPLSSSKTVYPISNTTYQLYCQNNPGDGRAVVSSFKNLTINVNGPSSSSATNSSLPTINSFYLSPSVVTQGQKTTAFWSSSNATQCFGQDLVTGAIETLQANGSVVLAPTSNRLYKLWCTNTSGSSVEKTANVVVQ